MTTNNESELSAATEALKAAGDSQQAEDLIVLDAANAGAQEKLGLDKEGLVQRMVYGPQPDIGELTSGVEAFLQAGNEASDKILATSLEKLASGEAFTADNKISDQLRKAITADRAYGYTVPAEFGGLGLNYNQLSLLQEDWTANGLGSLAVEVNGQLTIGSSALLGYGSDEQKSTYLPLIADGQLIAFALTEVGVGVNAKRVKSWVERDEENQCFRLHGEGACNKLYITSATHGGLAAIVARRGKESRDIGLFIVELPKEDVDGEYGFTCRSSNVSAFSQNINSRLSFRNFPIPFENEIQGNGVEVLFYCLRIGRCMLASMSAGFQRMLAADAYSYACQRDGVGGKVIKHELPRLGLAKMLGGSLVAQSLSHLSLAQDRDHVSLEGLRDITKSASARYLMESLIACERVIGGRSLDNDSRITHMRATAHAFGIVEGEDDLIRLSMVKDVTASFTDSRLKGVLSALQNINFDKEGNLLPEDKRILSLGPKNFLKFPFRSFGALGKLITNRDFWKLSSWVVKSVVADFIRIPLRLVPTQFMSRYTSLPLNLARHLRFAERELKFIRWSYLFLNLSYQLELTKAQIPMQRLGKRIEILVAMATLSCHASKLDRSCNAAAEAQLELMRTELKALNICTEKRSIDKLRSALDRIEACAESDGLTSINSVQPEPFAHQWEEK